MTLRKFLLLPLFISLCFILIYIEPILDTAMYILAEIKWSGALILSLMLAIILQFIGHWFRAKKAVELYKPVQDSSTAVQFRAFSVGQLFNSILPFRIGELVRMVIISQNLNISYTFTLILIIFERAVDVIFVSLLAISFSILFLGGSLDQLGFLYIFFGVGVMLLILIKVTQSPPHWLLHVIYITSGLFNDRLKNLARFKFWSLGYGLSRSLRLHVLLRYFVLAGMMWLCYLGSVAIVIWVLIPDLDIVHTIALSVAPYIGVAAPAGPAGLGVYSSTVGAMAQDVLSGSELTLLSIITWAIIVLPVSFAGALLVIFSRERVWVKRPLGSSDVSLSNKVMRNEDVSNELTHFLDSYYQGHQLSRVVNELEAAGKFSLVKYFRGGSDAITILVLQDGRRVVKKIIPIELKDRLKAQYDWLRKYGGDLIVRAKREDTEERYYSIDIAYDKSSIPLFDYIHETSLTRAQAAVRDAWVGVAGRVYGQLSAPSQDVEAGEQYIKKHILDCFDKAAAVDGRLYDAIRQSKLIINGREYDNLYQVLKKIKTHPSAWSDITTFRRSEAVHGDMIVDNLLYSQKKKKVIVIDPAPDGNIFEGPVFDFGKAAQSLYCGYEFLLRDESSVGIDGRMISFTESKSTRYSELDAYVRSTLAKDYLTAAEQRAVLFHAGVLFIRRLKHQVHYTPENALKFYAVGVRTLNDFLAQYDR